MIYVDREGPDQNAYRHRLIAENTNELKSVKAFTFIRTLARYNGLPIHVDHEGPYKNAHLYRLIKTFAIRLQNH